MNIAIIGAGAVGKALASATSRKGHDVVLTASDPEHARAAAAETGASAMTTNSEAADGAAIVILAVPYPAAASVADEIAKDAQSVVIDATNPLKPDFSGLMTTTSSAAEEIQERLPDASVVKAFNTIFARQHANPMVDGTQLDGYYAGDDTDAKQRVAGLLDDLGYRPIDVGRLCNASALEHMAFLNIDLNARNGWSWKTGWKLVGPTS